jgi:hypothetical protein
MDAIEAVGDMEAFALATAIAKQLDLSYGKELIIQAAAIKFLRLGVKPEKIHGILHDLMDGITKLDK